MSDENLIKKTCKELGLTYRELAERIGYGEGAIKNSASSGDISEPMKKAIELIARLHQKEQELKEFEGFKELIRKIK